MKRIIPWLPDWAGAGIIAGAGWAIWAIIANYPAGLFAAFKAGGTQFVLSFFVAGVLTSICSFMYKVSNIKMFQIALAVIIPLLFQFTFQYGLHYIAGTPYIIKTITPVMIIGLIWVSFYTRRMVKSIDGAKPIPA